MTMIWNYTKYGISLILLAILMTGCFKSEYTKLVESELKKGIRQDSILLGINFGDTRNDFYGKCFDLNKAHLVTQGEGFSVQYLFKDSLFHKEPTEIRLLFVPAFDDQEKLTNMDLKFSYPNLNPLDIKSQADTLKIKVIKILTHWYGGNTFVIANVGENKIPVKLDGNRRIMVYNHDAQSIVVRVQDILHPKFMHSTTAAKE